MKKYEFSYNEFSDLFNELYKTDGLDETLRKESFTKENFNLILKELQKIISNPLILEISEEKDDKEIIDIFQESTNKEFNELLADDDLMFFGHGGAGKKIIETEFHCRYPNLQSHFVGLSKTNKAFEMLKNWPHKGCNEIAIMALNKKEFNPIYREREQENVYDQDIYTIPNEYFVGYYDAVEDKFYKNPNFKRRHEYDPTCTIYPREEFQTALRWMRGPEVAAKLYNEIREIILIMLFSSYQTIDEDGYKNILEQIDNHINKAIKLQEQITPELFDEFFENERKKALETMLDESDEELVWVDWDEDEDNKSK